MRKMDIKRLLYLQFSLLAVFVGLLGMAAFGLLIFDFQMPGTFRAIYLYRQGMVVNLLLLILFGLQHSLMARPFFKAMISRFFPAELERSGYVMASGFCLFLIAVLWTPSEPPIYDLREGPWRWPLHLLALSGLPFAFGAAQAIDALDLIGIRSMLNLAQGKPFRPEPFKLNWAYKLVRHPIYFGLLPLFWISPVMTHDHLFFAELMTAYLLIGIQFEEAGLVRQFGQTYRNYQAEVPMLIPIPLRRWFAKARKND